MTRVLVVSRLFTGFADGLAEGVWRPRGAPTIYKLLEALAARPDIDLVTVFSLKNQTPDPRFKRATRLDLPPLGTVYVLPSRELGRGPITRRLSFLLTEVEQVLRCLWIARRHRSQAAYLTAGNFSPAAAFARLTKVRTILRFMGVFPFHRRLVDGAQPFSRWLFASPFDHVVCTEDGSDPGALLPRLLRPGVPVSVRLNGVAPVPDDGAATEALRQAMDLGGRPVVTFLGRLEPYKGCDEFVAVAEAVLARRPDAADFLVIGDGSRRAALEERVRAAGLEARVRFTGAIDHATIMRYLTLTTVYVSLNLYGNLSNANLEALSAGACMLIPAPDPDNHIDVGTTSVLPPDVVPRFDRHDMVGGLSDALVALLADPDRVAALRYETRTLAGRLLGSWEDRVDQEITTIIGASDAAQLEDCR